MLNGDYMKKLTKKEIIGIIELLICTMIWGFAFIAQKEASNYITPLFLNGIRFLIAGIILIPITIFIIYKEKKAGIYKGFTKALFIGFLMGLTLGIASNIQQFGIERTTAGKAGFLTAMYIVLVPIFIFIIFRKKLSVIQIIGIVVAVVGVGLISLKKDFSINLGDALCMLGAVFFTVEIIIVDYYSKEINPFVLSMVCFITIGVLSLFIAIPVDYNKFSMEGIKKAIIPLLFLSIGSSCIAYTLQNLGQQKVDGTKASLILCLESVFALIGSMILLDERLNLKEWFGSTLVLAGVFLVQLFAIKDEKLDNKETKIEENIEE